MKQIKGSLAFIVVMVVSTTFAVLSAIFSYNQYLVLKQHAFHEAKVNMKTLMMITQARFDKEFRHEDEDSVAREVMALNLLDDIRLSAVIDQNGVIRYSSSFVILEKPALGQLKQYNASLFKRVIQSRNPLIVSNQDSDVLYAYYPLEMGGQQSGLRSNQIGVLFVEWSMSRPYHNIRNSILQNVLYMWLLIGMVMLVLLLVLRKIVLVPIRSLKLKADQIATGLETEQFKDNGFAELGELSNALNRMNIKLNKSLHDIGMNEQRWVFALDGSGDGVQDWNLISGECYFSPQFKKLFGYTATNPVTLQRWKAMVDDADWAYVDRKIQRHIEGLAPFCRIEYGFRHASGEQRFMLMRGKVVELQGNGTAVRFIATHSDITARRRMEDALRSSEEKYRMLFDMAQEGIWVLDANGCTTLVNDAMANILGYSREDMIGRDMLDFVKDKSLRTMTDKANIQGHAATIQRDCELVSRTGRRIYTTMQSAALFDNLGVCSGMIIGVMDITERKYSEERIRQQVLYDELTKLPNRRMLNEKLSQEQARSIRHGHTGALLFIDLDHFKNVNDSLGHPIGDGLLVAIADRLNNVVRAEDTLARLGGDEFVVLLPQIDSSASVAASVARNVALKIQAALSETFDVSGHKLNVSCSVGIALYPLDQETIHDIMKQADAAMYRAKAEGRSAVCLFSKEMHQQIEQNLMLQMLLPAALEDEQFILYFQPQFNHLNQLIGAEVLLRWEEPNLGFVRPDLFIRAAEESGLIVPLGDWVLKNPVNNYAYGVTTACLKALNGLQSISVRVSFRRMILPVRCRHLPSQPEFVQMKLSWK